MCYFKLNLKGIMFLKDFECVFYNSWFNVVIVNVLCCISLGINVLLKII